MTGASHPQLTTCLLVAALLLTPGRRLFGPRSPSPTASLRPSAPADTIVDSFHGYDLGTPGDRIGEIEVSRPPDDRVDGLAVYARSLRFIAMPTRAYFYLDTAEHRLRRGKHLIEPDASSCVRELTTLRLMVGGTHPELTVRIVRATGAARDTAAVRDGVPSIRCPAFMEAEEPRARTVLFRNPETDAVEVRMELFRRDGKPRILACYLNESDCVWPDSVAVEPGPQMLAPGRRPDTAGAAPEEDRG